MKEFFSCDFYRRPRVITLNCPLDFLVTLAIDLWKSLIWSHLYRVSQKFVPLISCTITFDQNFILREISRRCLFLCQSTCVQNFSNWHALFVLFFFITFCSRRGMNWDTAWRPTNDPFWAFLSPGAQDPVQPPNNFFLV